MFEGVAMFVETMLGLWNVIKAGIAIGNLGDGSNSSFTNLMQTVHQSAWADITANDGLNSGQLALAEMAQSSGEDYINSVSIHTWDAQDYMSAIYGDVDGASEALSHSVEKAAVAINHATTSTATGIAQWANDLQEFAL